MLKCKYCERQAVVKGYCKTDYSYLRRNNIAFSDTQLCLDSLSKRDKNKIKTKRDKCLYCEKKATIKGYCKKHYNYLSRHKASFKDTKKCIDLLKENDRKKHCLFCGDEHNAKGFCKSCYMYLYSRNIDMNNEELCLKALINSHKGITKRCLEQKLFNSKNSIKE